MQYEIANILIKTNLTTCLTLREQRIVDIHDKFEASIQNLEAQLKQREKQYDYYRS